MQTILKPFQGWPAQSTSFMCAQLRQEQQNSPVSDKRNPEMRKQIANAVQLQEIFVLAGEAGWPRGLQ
jgi:hypothetical protein